MSNPSALSPPPLLTTARLFVLFDVTMTGLGNGSAEIHAGSFYFLVAPVGAARLCRMRGGRAPTSRRR